MNDFVFSDVTREDLKLKVLVTGPSGAGKTLSALYIAKGIGGKVAFLDTENDSGKLYHGKQDTPDFKHLSLKPPYTTERYMAAMTAAIKAGFDILIVDSLSHQWAGEGGVLSRKEQMDARGGDSFRNWGKLTPEQEKLKAFIVNAPIHMICTTRSKQDYAMITPEGGGKAKVQKLGMAPVQREGMEYEFTLSIDMAMNHEAETSKDRTSLFDGKIFKPTVETGRLLVEWLKGSSDKPVAVPPNTQQQVASPSAAPVEQPKQPDYKPANADILQAALKSSKFDWKGKVASFIQETIKKSIPELTPEETSKVAEIIKTKEVTKALEEFKAEQEKSKNNFENFMSQGDLAL